MIFRKAVRGFGDGAGEETLRGQNIICKESCRLEREMRRGVLYLAVTLKVFKVIYFEFQRYIWKVVAV